MKNIRLLFLVAMTIFLSACTKIDPFVPKVEKPIAIPEYSFDNETNSKLMFQDSESMDLLTSPNREYEIAKVLRVVPVDKNTIEVANFAPVDIQEAIIIMTVKGMPKAVKLFKIKKIRAHAVQTIKYPFINGDTNFPDVDNVKVSLAKYKDTGIEPSDVSFDFIGNTSLIDKLKKLSKLKWKIRYHDYDPTDNPNDNWKENISAKDIRRFSGLMINLAYLYQLEETKNEFIKENIIGNDGVTPLSEQQKRDTYQRLINIPSFLCGVCVNVSGLGGQNVFGVADHVLRDYIKGDVSFITMHEIGHMLDFNHSSSMTYPKDGKGACSAVGRIYNKLLKTNDLPVRMDNYYKLSDIINLPSAGYHKKESLTCTL